MKILNLYAIYSFMKVFFKDNPEAVEKIASATGLSLEKVTELAEAEAKAG